jgi:hypothetical protein
MSLEWEQVIVDAFSCSDASTATTATSRVASVPDPHFDTGSSVKLSRTHQT